MSLAVIDVKIDAKKHCKINGEIVFHITESNECFIGKSSFARKAFEKKINKK